MIIKERLEELIKEGATVYSLLHGGIEKVDLAKARIFGRTDNYIYIQYWCNTFDQYIETSNERLYETEKQAEWALKYQSTRIEKLALPMWEEFKDYHESISVSFVGEDWCIYELSKQTLNNKLYLKLVEDAEVWKRWDFNEENYIKACDLCLKLFEGEENGNN